jgi:uncharacterized membrane protein YcaP (DUF421 family)
VDTTRDSSRRSPLQALTPRQRIGLPFIFGLPILALFGFFGPARAGVVARMTVVYVFVLAGFRVLGKRELSQMSPVEIVTLFFVPQLFRNAIMRDDNTMLSGIIGALTLFALVFLCSLLTYWVRTVRRILLPSPSVLLRDGMPDDTVLDQERVTTDDIASAARKAGVEELEQVHRATLEGDGRISVVPRDGIRRIVPQQVVDR